MSTLLSLAELAFNNSPSEPTGVSPLFAKKGYPERDLAFAAGLDFVRDLGSSHKHLRENVSAAQARYQVHADH